MGKIVFKNFNEDDGYYNINLAYLSKEQFEEIEALVSKWNPADEDIKDCIRMCLTDANEQRFNAYGTTFEACLNWLEKQTEQKSVDKIEQKFHEGDWIVNNDNGGICQVTEIKDDEYCLWPLDSEILGYLRIIDVDNDYHLWTIQDAKDGDVLAGSKITSQVRNKEDVILMFRGIGNTEWDDVIDYHCYYDCYRKDFIVQEDVEYWGNVENNQLVPATKDQRDFLLQKMKESGYEWDNKKKELKKIYKNTCENKGVDLEEEKNGYWYKLCDSEFVELLEINAKLFDIAKHFFELGLKAQKGE